MGVAITADKLEGDGGGCDAATGGWGAGLTTGCGLGLGVGAGAGAGGVGGGGAGAGAGAAVVPSGITFWGNWPTSCSSSKAQQVAVPAAKASDRHRLHVRLCVLGLWACRHKQCARIVRLAGTSTAAFTEFV
jgi:hypothetical protein